MDVYLRETFARKVPTSLPAKSFYDIQIPSCLTVIAPEALGELK